MLNGSRFGRNRWRIAATAFALAGAFALVGCGKKSDTQAAVGQVIAHVGPDDVTQQEVDNELRLANVPADKRSDEVMKQALQRIVERKYLVQQAIAAKIDREPTVHLDLLRSREQILAGSYVQRDIQSKASAISKSEVDAYIQAHPAQFADRQLFQIEQISLALQPDMAALTAATKDFKSLDQVEEQLNHMGIKFDRGTATLDSAVIPPEMLKALLGRKTDDIFFIRAQRGATFFKVVSVEAKPLAPEQADAFARREMRNALASKSAVDTMKAALAGTKFEGDYARIMNLPTPGAPAAPAATTPAGGATPAAGDAGSADKPADDTKK